MNTSKSSIFKTISGAVALVGALGFASQASAYTFDVCEAGGFTGSDSPNDIANGVVAPNNSIGGASCNGGGNDQGLYWFPNSPPDASMLEIDFFAFQLTLDLTQDSDMDMDIIARITQTNNEIFTEDSVNAQGFPYVHTLTGAGDFVIADQAGTEVLADPAAFFSITHTETLNAGPCPTTNTVSPACEDSWAFTIVPPPGFSVDFVSADAPGFIFTASFDLVVLPPNVVIGNTVYTPEIQPGMSFIDVKLAIESRRVPEPGTLALFGLGLAGLGFAGRRKRS